MFSVYGVQGRIFSGPVDQWRRVAQVSALHRSAALRPGSPQGRSVDSGHEAATAAAATLSAYTDTQQGGGQRHPLSQVHQPLDGQCLAHLPQRSEAGRCDPRPGRALEPQDRAQAHAVDARGRGCSGGVTQTLQSVQTCQGRTWVQGPVGAPPAAWRGPGI